MNHAVLSRESSPGASTTPAGRSDRSGSPLVVGMIVAVCLSTTAVIATVQADEPTNVDERQSRLRDLNGYFPFQPVASAEQWPARRAEIRRRILVSQGLWPLPPKSPLHPVIHGRVERDDYVVDRVYFESVPDHYVTGSLYRPKHASGPLPAVLSPHGHWQDGRFYDTGEEGIENELNSGAESFRVGGRYPIQARAVQLARMGCLVFVYDMTGYADSIQLAHRLSRLDHRDQQSGWGFMSVPADLHLQNMMGLQTWNSLRALDFLLTLPETDPTRIGVTGASGGGTQTMVLAAIDDRIAAAMPCVMVSTAMQGGCTCENAPLLRIGQGNIDIAAATAPRPLGLTAADDWTRELETKGYPELQGLYTMLGKPAQLTAVFHTEFPHNYNQVNRLVMYAFFNRHFELGHNEPIRERDFQPLSREEASVWTAEHPRPSGDRVGDRHEVELLRWATAESQRQMKRLVPESSAAWEEYRRVVGGAWETMLGRRLTEVGKVSFTKTELRDLGFATLRSGTLVRQANGETVSIVHIAPPATSVGTVVWGVDPTRPPAVNGSSLDPWIRAAVERGLTVIVANLIGADTESQRMLPTGSGSEWQGYSGYTYGYNHSLFAQRAHDLLTTIHYARSLDLPVHLAGIGPTAGPVAAAAGSQALGQLASMIVDSGGFDFAEIDRYDHPMLVPGAMKYFGVDGLLSLCAPQRLLVIGEQEWPVARQVYRAAGMGDQFTAKSALSDELQLFQWWLGE